MSSSLSSAHPDISSGKFGSDHRLFNHAVQFYRDENCLLRPITELISSAFCAGDGAVLIATSAHLQEIVKRMEGLGIDVHCGRGRFITMDAGEVLSHCTAQGKVDLEILRPLLRRIFTPSEPASEGKSRLFVYGELVGLLCAEGKFEAALAVEQVWDALLHEFNFSLLCGYPIEALERRGTESSFVRVCAAHQTIIPPDSYSSPESESRLLRALAADASPNIS